jgi:hypothetical protein
MAMQTDVKAAHAEATGSMVSGRTRLKAYHAISGGTAGDVIFTDGSGGATLLRFNIGTGTQPVTMLVPGEGILAESGIYVTLPTAAKVTVFYG